MLCAHVLPKINALDVYSYDLGARFTENAPQVFFMLFSYALCARLTETASHVFSYALSAQFTENK